MLLLLDRVIRGIVRGAEILSGLILVLSIGINFVNIVGRYAFHSPIPWAEEVMLYLMLALVFLGAGMVSLRGRHIRMDVVLHFLPPKLRVAFDVLAELVFLVVAVVVIWLAVPTVLQFKDFDQRSEAANIPVWIPHSVVPLGIGIMVLATLARLAERWVHGAPIEPDPNAAESGGA